MDGRVEEWVDKCRLLFSFRSMFAFQWETEGGQSGVEVEMGKNW